MITEILGNLTFCNKQHVTIRRNFYNSKGAINFLLHNIRKKRMDVSNMVYKEKEEPEVTLTLKDMFLSREALEKHHFLAFHLKEWWAHVKNDYARYSAKKRYIEDVLLGADIASTKFVLRSGGRVKPYGQDNWLEKNGKRLPELPTVHDPDFVLESIDFRGCPIVFENWEYVCNLLQLRWLCVRGCSTIDDWVLDKIAMEFPALEYLDVSNCEKVTERGLEALYKMPNLKKLIVTNFYESAALELTCFMLEDINPYLKCEILKPDVELIEDK